MSSVDLGTAPFPPLLALRHPTVAAMLVTGIYVTIDGIFVGHILGQDGLAGMMLAYPSAPCSTRWGPDRHGILVAGLLLSGQGSRPGRATSSAMPW